MTSLKKAIIIRYIYIALKPKKIKTKSYKYDHHFLLLILIYFNLFRKVFLTTIHVPQIDARCLLYLFHLSLVIFMLICLNGLKECGLDTKIIGIGYPLSEVGTGLEKKMTCSSPHHLIIWACYPGPETENTTLHQKLSPFNR